MGSGCATSQPGLLLAQLWHRLPLSRLQRQTALVLLQTSSSLAPAALGAEALKLLSAVPAAVVAFGSALCGEIAGYFNIQGAYYALLLSLAISVYYSYATAWFVSAFALLTGAPAAATTASAYACSRETSLSAADVNS
jgi:hypothetical protein